MIAHGNTCLRAQSAQHNYESNCMRFDDATIIFGRQKKYSRLLKSTASAKTFRRSLTIHQSQEIYYRITKENASTVDSIGSLATTPEASNEFRLPDKDLRTRHNYSTIIQMPRYVS